MEQVIKYVFCSYRGILIVHDIHGIKIDRLSGEMTLEKYKEIEKLSNHNTEFDGLENYKHFASEKEDESDEPDFSSFSSPVQAPNVSNFTIENTSQKSLPVILFGAIESIMATNFGFAGGVTIDKPQQYSQFLARTISQPIIVKSLIIKNVDKINCGVIEIKKKSPTGAVNTLNLDISNQFQQFQQDVFQHQLYLILDEHTEFNFDLAGNSKINIQLFH